MSRVTRLTSRIIRITNSVEFPDTRVPNLTSGAIATRGKSDLADLAIHLSLMFVICFLKGIKIGRQRQFIDSAFRSRIRLYAETFLDAD